MSREEKIQKLVEMGYPADKADAIPDDVLDTFLEMLEPVEEETPEPDTAMGDDPMNPLDKPMVDRMADMTPEEMQQALIGKGYAEADVMALSPEDLKTFYDQEFPAEPVEPAAPPVAAMSERAKGRLNHFADSQTRRLVDSLVKEAFKKIEARFAPVKNQVDTLELNTRRASVRKFCEVKVEEGRLLPAQFTSVYERLMRADNTKPIRTFSEKDGKIHLRTELQRQMDELDAAPVIFSFAERMKQPVGTIDSEKAKVEQHFTAFSEQFAKHGHTLEKRLKAFEIARKNNPRLSAADFIAGKQ